jgi:uncharacterized protein (TIGR02301 family)
MMRRLLISLAACFAAAPLAAQEMDYRQRAEDLVAISRIFGELHHIRRNCERDEAEVWRDRMRKLVEFEMPQADLREQMVLSFNDGFRNAERRHRYCDRDARNHAASIAAEGDRVATRLLEPLYNSLTEETSGYWDRLDDSDDGDDDGE